MNFADFEGKLCTRIPWERKIVRFFDYILRIDPDLARQRLQKYVPMYIGDLREVFREEEIAYLKWISSHLHLMNSINKVIKAVIGKVPIGTFIKPIIPGDFFYSRVYSDFLDSSSEEILRQFRMNKTTYYAKAKEGAEKLGGNLIAYNQKYKYQFFKPTLEMGFFYIQVLPGLKNSGELRLYLTVKPDKVIELSSKLAEIFLGIAHKRRARIDFKFALDYRPDSIVIYGGKYLQDSIKKLEDSWFLDFHMPFTRKLAKGRGLSLDKGTEIAQKLNLNWRKEEVSNGSVICHLISEAFNNFSKRFDRYPKDEHENLIIILEACYPLFEKGINLYDAAL